MDIKQLAINLAHAETEEEIIELLKTNKIWEDYSYWRSFGDNDNNFSTIGNQQSKADTALVEKLINSVDAILMKECLVRGIDMSGEDAPQSISEALENFFGIREGQISYLDVATRNKMSEDIILAATGKKRGGMNLVIADKGEGQTPKSMPDTILSISKNNKLKVPFVQGKFNMGGTGALPFCGHNRMQVVVSKRCPSIPNEKNDATFNKWSVTVVRREEAREGRKSSMYTYLTDASGNLLSFETDSLPIIPTTFNTKEYEDMEYGTFIKLMNYGIQGYKSNILFDFNYRMSMLMPDLAHPIRLRECREYQGHSLESTLSGLETRLSDDREGNIEDGFPSSSTFSVDGQNLKCSIYAFKKGRARNYREDDGILFIVNGQTHASIGDSFYNRVGLGYLADSLLILVDCSALDVTHREDMFMNSRDRLRNGEFSKDVQSAIVAIVKDHPGLKDLQHDRRAAAIQEKLSDDKPLQNVLQDILSKSPVLSKILLSGAKLKNPFDIRPSSGEKEKYEGKKHPTFFSIKGKLEDGVFKRTRPINHDFRIQFETDVENDYFARPMEQGAFILKVNGEERNDLIKHLGLFNGIATLTMRFPEGIKEGDVISCKSEIDDEYILDNFENMFEIEATKPEEYKGGSGGERKPPKNQDESGKRESPETAALPNVQEVYSDQWDQYNMDKESAMIMYSTDEGDDFFLNMDNQYFLTELKAIKDKDRTELSKARYKYSMTLIGMSVVSYYKDKEEVDSAEQVKIVSTLIAPILIPMLDAMAELDLSAV